MTSTNRFVTLTATTVITPPSRNGSLPALTHLTALAMFVAEQDADTGWRFTLTSQAIGAGDSENLLLGWATDALPETGIVIGWQLADAVVAPLLDAASGGDPEIAPPFLDRLVGLVSGTSVDLAVAHGGGAAPPLAEVAATHGIRVTSIAPAKVESAWAIGDTDLLATEARAQAVGAWRLWLAEAPASAGSVAGDFAHWLATENARDPADEGR